MDFTFLNEGLPIFGFVLVFVIAYATLARTKILGENKPINAVTSFILGIIFLSFSSVRTLVTNITPWFAVLLTISFFFLMIITFLIKDDWAKLTKPSAIVFIILFALIIIIAFFYSFPGTQAYLPGADESGANDFLLSIKHFLLATKFLNGALLLIIAVIVGFIITR